ncbi:hypothetical protein [Brucella pseudogrignonensis]|uniref:hypothetical protein n=1 Tax=Brucella pseudogrignonensis TaxID=419475 RepID=UPI00132AE326|nr:hypothetical protein [Brucella pseudogrignonensis]KAB2689229.1 hypothetical protein F9K82_11360 [Brucella pseudogrignonensis]
METITTLGHTFVVPINLGVSLSREQAAESPQQAASAPAVIAVGLLQFRFRIASAWLHTQRLCWVTFCGPGENIMPMTSLLPQHK